MKPDTIKIGRLISEEELKLFSPSCKNPKQYADALDAACKEFGILTPRQIRHFMAHLSVESAYFTRLTENLNYSAKRLTQVWPSRFPTLRDAQPYARNPKALANKVYGGRLGNTGPNDGSLYIGRGFIQLTGKANYEAAGNALGLDLVGNPSLAADPYVAARIAGWYWKKKNLNKIVEPDITETKFPHKEENLKLEIAKHLSTNEDDDLIQGTRAINGGLIGLKERRMELYKAAFIWKD